MSLAVLAKLVWSLIVLARPLVVLVILVSPLLVLVFPLVVVVCPLVVLVVLSVGLFIADLESMAFVRLLLNKQIEILHSLLYTLVVRKKQK